MKETINAGYVITDKITMAGSTYVLGHNPKAPSPYVTWSQDPDGGYSFGKYFSAEEDARNNLLKRAMECVPENQLQAFIEDGVPFHIKDTIVEDYRKSCALGDIENCLEYALNALNLDEAHVQTLLQNETFRDAAMHTYYRQDHSYENEALTDSLKYLLEERFPNLLQALESTEEKKLDDLIAGAESRRGNPIPAHAPTKER